MNQPEPEPSRVPVLMYHRIGRACCDAEVRYCVSPERFVGHMHALAKRGLRACSIDDFVMWLEGGIALDTDTFLLTFDDGFRGIYEHASPVLRQLGWPACVFLVSSLIGGTDAWQHGDGFSSGNHSLLNATEIGELRRYGFSFHSHSRTHADLTGLGDDALRQEIVGSKSELETLLRAPVHYFAYPYGKYDQRAMHVVRAAGYRAAFSVDPGFNRQGTDAYQLRRLDVFGTDTPASLVRKVRFGTNAGSLANSARYYAGRLGARLGLPTRSTPDAVDR